jgi:hypothetical protein
VAKPKAAALKEIRRLTYRRRSGTKTGSRRDAAALRHAYNDVRKEFCLSSQTTRRW